MWRDCTAGRADSETARTKNHPAEVTAQGGFPVSAQAAGRQPPERGEGIGCGGRKNENLRKFLLHFVKRCDMITKLSMRHAPLAQLDRASGYGPEGRGFESLTACHPETVAMQRLRGFALPFLGGERTPMSFRVLRRCSPAGMRGLLSRLLRDRTAHR